MAFKRKLAVNKLQFDVNIVPIVDCLTILIIFILASGVYVSVGILDVNIAQEDKAAASGSNDAADEQISVAVNDDYSIVVHATGKMNRSIEIPKIGNEWNFKRLAKELGDLKKSFPKLNKLTVEPKGEVPYQYVVHTMEVSRATHPEVLLGGF